MSDRLPDTGAAPPQRVRPLRICIVYDRLYPYSVGGAERWYRRLAERLANDGHEVTYLTSRQWPRACRPEISGAHVAVGAPARTIYGARRRRLGPVLRFSLSVFWHLLRHGRDYDVVHSAAMSSLSALAIVWLSRLHGYRAVLDWWEVWSLPYWRSYLGSTTGILGWVTQLLLARSPHQPLAHATRHANRLARLRRGGPVPVLRGLMPAMSGTPSPPQAAELRLVFLGRHIPEKQVAAIPPALALARASIPGLRATIFGAGPETGQVRAACRAAGVAGCVELPGFVAEPDLQRSLATALCLVLPSRREGFGLAVTEAAALGVPSVVLDHPDSAAAELIVAAVNGFTCASTAPAAFASAILRVHEAGYELRQQTLAWFQSNAAELTIDGAIPQLLALYRGHGVEEQAPG